MYTQQRSFIIGYLLMFQGCKTKIKLQAMLHNNIDYNRTLFVAILNV